MNDLRARVKPKGALWRHADFVKLWTGQSISELGSQVSQLAIPWVAAVVLHVSPFVFSLLATLGFLPFIIFALPAGVWVDRLRRRPILIFGDAGRAVLLATIPLAYGLGILTVWQLLAVQFAVGILTVFFDVAYQSYLPFLVDREHLVEGNSKLQLTVSVAQVAGPSFSGGLIAAITAPYAIVADAISYVASTGFMLRIRKEEVLPERTADRPPRTMLPELKEGLRWVVKSPYLRSIAACTGTSNFFGNVGFAIFVLYAVRVLHMSAVEVGGAFAAGSVGAIVGALAIDRVRRVIGVGPAIVWNAVLFSVGALAFPLAPKSGPLPVLVAGFFVLSFGSVAYNITQVSLRQSITPERLQGRMNAAMRWIVWGTIPLGNLVGGGLATALGLHAALWFGAAGNLFTFLFVALSPVRSIREMPEPVVEPTPAEAEAAGGVIEPAPVIVEPGPPAADVEA
jgi:MFS family permease